MREGCEGPAHSHQVTGQITVNWKIFTKTATTPRVTDHYSCGNDLLRIYWRGIILKGVQAVTAYNTELRLKKVTCKTYKLAIALLSMLQKGFVAKGFNRVVFMGGGAIK